MFCFNQKFQTRTKILFLKYLSGLDNLPQRGCFDKQLLPNKNNLPKRCIGGVTQTPSVVKRWPRLTYPPHEGRHDLKILGLLHIEEGERTQEESERCLEGQRKYALG